MFDLYNLIQIDNLFYYRIRVNYNSDRLEKLRSVSPVAENRINIESEHKEKKIESNLQTAQLAPHSLQDTRFSEN